MYSSKLANVNIPNQESNFHQSQFGRQDRKLSFVVVGAGLIGPRHASHIVSRHDCKLFAIVDHSLNGPSVAQTFNTKLFKQLPDLFEFCHRNNVKFPDAAIIATPNHTHLQIGMQLAKNGIHILMEKPLAPSAIECKTLIEYCYSKQVALLVGHHRRFNPYITAAKNSLFKLGKIIAVQGSWTLCKPQSYFLEKPWRSSKQKGGGTLLINLIHDLDLLQFLMGPIEKVYAELLMKQRSATDNDEDMLTYDDLVDEGAVLTLKFANGCCGTFVCADNVTSPFLFEAGTGENPTIPFNDSISGFYRIFGSSGTLSLPDMKLYHQFTENESSWLKPISTCDIPLDYREANHDLFGMISPSPSPDTKFEFNEKPKPFDLQLDHFINIINGDESIVKCTGEDALQALLCIDAVMKSIDTGLPQYVERVESVQPDLDLLATFG